MQMTGFQIAAAVLTLSLVAVAQAQETMQHGMSHHDTVVVAESMQGVPPSGTAREAGYEGRYGFISTMENEPLQSQCARAERGLIMIDRKTWQQCRQRDSLAVNLPAQSMHRDGGTPGHLHN